MLHPVAQKMIYPVAPEIACVDQKVDQAERDPWDHQDSEDHQVYLI